MITSTHPCREELFAFLVGTLHEEAAETLADHVESCTDCQTTLASLDESKDELVAMLRRQEDARPYAREPQWQAAAERARAVAVGLVSMADDDEPGVSPAILPQLGEYELLEKLGQGGMGAVYRARHTRLKRIVALKVLPPEKTDDRQAIARFEREMEAVGQLVHANIVQAHDARKIDGTYLLVMEYVDGMDLARLSRRLGPLPVADACEIVRQAALGLQYAHEHGLVHRDIKPSNLMLHCIRHTPCAVQGASPTTPFQTPNDAQPTAPDGADGTRRVPSTLDGSTVSVKILDLGLALLGEERRDAAVEAELTTAGHPMGTADYIAPEQADDAHSVDIRADVYSLGCTLYKLLSGRAPFAGPRYKSDFDKMMAHCRDPIAPIRQTRADVPEELEAVLDRMTAKDPAARFATPAALEAAIAPWAAGADLAALLAQAARQTESAPLPEQQRGVSTMSHASSALQGTDPVGLPHAGEAAAEAGAPTLPYSPAPRSSRLRRVPRWAIAAGLLPVALFLGVILWINNTRIEVPDGSEVNVAQDGTVTVTLPDGKVQVTRPKPQAAPKRDAQPAAANGQARSAVPGRIVLTPEPLEIAAGEPLSRNALVLQPTPIEGVRSWSIETIAHRGSNPLAAFSPDSRTVATVCTDPTIRLWDVASRALLRAFVAHEGSIRGITWCPDGRLLATASADRTVRIWEVESGRRVATFQGKSAFTCIDWSSDGRRLAAGRTDGTVHFWEFMLATDDPAAWTHRLGWQPVRKSVRTREVTSQGVHTLRWSPDGKRLATADGRQLGLWDGEQGVLTRVVPVSSWWNHRHGTSLAWSPDGSQIVTTGRSGGGPPQFLSAATGELLFEGPAKMRAGETVAWSPDGTRVSGRGYYGRTTWGDFSFEVESGKVVVQKPGNWECSALAYSPDGKLLAASQYMGGVELCDADSVVPLAVLPAHIGQVRVAAWSPDGGTICTSSAPGNGAATRLVRMTSAETFWETTGGSLGHASPTWSMDAKWVKAMDHRVYDGTSGRYLFQLTAAHAGAAASSSPTEAVLATYRQDRPTKFFDMSSGKLLREFPRGHSALTWSPDGKSVAVAAGHEITLRDAHSFEVAATITVPARDVRVLAWSPDGRLLAAGMADGKVHVFDIESGALLRTGEGHTSTVRSLAWLDEGSKLASGTSTEVCVWDASGKLLRTIPDDGGAFSPDGRLVASRGPSSLRLWDLDDGRYLRTLLTLRDHQYAAISPDGHYNGSPDVEAEFVYIIQTDQGQQTLTPAEFSERYGWKNDPAKLPGAQDLPAGTAEADGP